jgi:O-antigen ligase
MVFVLIKIYSALAVNGYLGQKNQEKYLSQSEGRYGIVINGRVNVVGAVLALRDSPLVGYGSWAEDRNRYFEQALELVGFDPRIYSGAEDVVTMRIPTHSYLLEAWVEHGALAAIFWIYALYFLIKFMRHYPIKDRAYLALMCVQFWLFLWNIFFSPLGSRPVVGAGLVSMIALQDYWRAHPCAPPEALRLGRWGDFPETYSQTGN